MLPPNTVSQFMIFMSAATIFFGVLAIIGFSVSIPAILQATKNEKNIEDLGNVTCLSNSECSPLTLGNVCLEAKCISGICRTNPIPGAECAFSTNCTVGVCNDQCMCVPECTMDSQCAEKTFGNHCINATCVSGECEFDLALGAKCAFSSMCSSGFCNDECMCMNATCVTDSDCGTVEWSQCFSEVCDDGYCFSRLTNSSTCVTSETCDSGFECKNCTCVEKPFTRCETDDDCGTIDWTTCLRKSCNATGFCEDVFSPGSTCAVDETCGQGFECENCNCQAEPIVGVCTNSSQCPTLNFTNCLVNECVDSICTPVLGDGNTCADASFCLNNQYCNEMCQCETFLGIDLIDSGTFSVSGATSISNCPWILYGNQFMKFFTYGGCGATATVTNSLFTLSSVIPIGHRPIFEHSFSVPVRNSMDAMPPITLGSLIISQDGELTWFVDGNTDFTSGNNVGFHRTTVSYNS